MDNQAQDATITPLFFGKQFMIPGPARIINPKCFDLRTLDAGDILTVSFKFRDGESRNRIWASFVIKEPAKLGSKKPTLAKISSFTAKGESWECLREINFILPQRGTVCKILGTRNAIFNGSIEEKPHMLIKGWRLDLVLNPNTPNNAYLVFEDQIAFWLIH
jgi:hypothetical protein